MANKAIIGGIPRTLAKRATDEHAAEAMAKAAQPAPEHPGVTFKIRHLALAGTFLALAGGVGGYLTRGAADATTKKVTDQSTRLNLANGELLRNGLQPTRNQTFSQVSTDKTRDGSAEVTVSCANMRTAPREDKPVLSPPGLKGVCVIETTTRVPYIMKAPLAQ